MKISTSHERMEPVSIRDSVRKDGSQLKRQIKDFLSAASCTPPDGCICPRCGQQTEYLDTVFSLYGDSATWHIRLPVCPCVTKFPFA